MASFDFESFSTLLLKQLEVGDKKALSTIDDHSKLVEQCLSNSKSEYMKKFVYDFNTVIVESKMKKYKIFENVLYHKLFENVLAEFKNSDVLIRACEALNKNAAEWLLTMNLNYDVQAESGATALMESAFRPTLYSVFEKLLKSNVDVNIVDNNGNNALFYATKNAKCLKTLLKKTTIDVNHLNKDNDSVLTYCCKMDRVGTLDILINQKSLDPNHADSNGKTAAMYLVENTQHNILKPFVLNNHIDPNYKNKYGQTLVSCFVNKYYQHCNGELEHIQLSNRSGYLRNKRYAYTLATLIDLKCDFNVPVDDDGNTPIMVFLMMKDYVSCQYLLERCGNLIDLSKKNYNDINASYLSLFISPEVFEGLLFKNNDIFSLKTLKKDFIDNPTFDKRYYGNDDINVTEAMKVTNKYQVSPGRSKVIQEWLLEVYFPRAVKSIRVPGYKFASEFAVFY